MVFSSTACPPPDADPPSLPPSLPPFSRLSLAVCPACPARRDGQRRALPPRPCVWPPALKAGEAASGKAVSGKDAFGKAPCLPASSPSPAFVRPFYDSGSPVWTSCPPLPPSPSLGVPPLAVHRPRLPSSSSGPAFFAAGGGAFPAASIVFFPAAAVAAKLFSDIFLKKKCSIDAVLNVTIRKIGIDTKAGMCPSAGRAFPKKGQKNFGPAEALFHQPLGEDGGLSPRTEGLIPARLAFTPLPTRRSPAR